MDIRPLSDSDDKLKISRIYEESWNHAYKGIVPQSFLDSISEGRWVPHLSDPGISVLVMTEAEHLCMTMRGIKKPGSKTVCLARRGLFATDPELEARFFRMLERNV